MHIGSIALGCIALGCIAGGSGLLLVVVAYLHSCHRQELRWLRKKLDEFAHREEGKREISLPPL